MKQTSNNQSAKGGSSDGTALSSNIEWLKNRESGWQFGEAGVIQAIASKLDCNKIAVEFGGGEAFGTLTIHRLINEKWTCVVIESNEIKHKNLQSYFEDRPEIHVINKTVSLEGDDSLCSILNNIGIDNPDVVVIDVDSNDIEHFEAMCRCGIKPKIVCIEHHDASDSSVNHKVSFVPQRDQYGKINDKIFHQQANVVAVDDAATKHGYKRVWTSRVNSIFVLEHLYEIIKSIPEDQNENTYDYDAFGCKRNWSKIDNPKVSMILSQPRLCFTDHSDRMIYLASKLKFNVFRASGAFWDRDIELVTRNAIETEYADFLLYSDYDSVFNPDDVFKMLEVINNDPSIAVIGAVQMSRHDDKPLVFETDKDYSTETTKVDYHHFGLTIIRRQVFEELPSPWFWSTPGVWPDGTVGWDAPGRSDADITFWRLLRNANMKVVQHNEVVIGHMVLCVKWPKDSGYGVQLQPIENYNRHGKPSNAKIDQDIYRKRMEEEAKKRQGMTNA